MLGGTREEWELLRELPHLQLEAVYSPQGSQKSEGEDYPLYDRLQALPASGEVQLLVDLLSSPDPGQRLRAELGPHGYLRVSSPSLLRSLLQPAAVKENRVEMEVILDSIHDGMIAVNGAGIITLFNAGAERVTGLSAAECLGSHATDVIPNTRLHCILESGESELNQRQEIGAVSIITNRVPLHNSQGEIIGAAAFFRDITEVRELAEEITDLREIRSLLEAIINSTQDAISVVNEEGIGMMINPAYTSLTGLTGKDVIGQPATVDIAEGESIHYRVLKEERPISGVRMKVGPKKREVIVDAAPITVKNQLKGSVAVIHDVSEIKNLTEELNQAKRLIRKLKAKYTFDDIIAVSKKMEATINQARRASSTPATILLRGESGTGKELFAHAIHNASPRAREQFVCVNCTAIAPSLLESELFGYEEGAFTGASKGGKKGFFEEADGGTIFLDEIGKIDLNLQAKLLRVLQEKEVLPVGGNKPLSVDVRVIVATNIKLEEAIQQGEFREDLYYRLNVFPINIPPLRQRKEDLSVLIHYLIRKFNQEYGRSVHSCTDEALQFLKGYHWPGNVRELENIIGRAMINLNLDEDIIRRRHLPPLGQHLSHHEQSILSQTEGEGRVPDLEHYSLRQLVENTEKEAIMFALQQSGGNKTEAASSLGIAIRSLYYKLEKYGL